LYLEWAQLESGTLELDSDGSGGIRCREWMGDWEANELILSWSTTQEGIAVLRQELDQGRPSARAFIQKNR
jgi:hypothetical protein